MSGTGIKSWGRGDQMFWHQCLQCGTHFNISTRSPCALMSPDAHCDSNASHIMCFLTDSQSTFSWNIIGLYCRVILRNNQSQFFVRKENDLYIGDTFFFISTHHSTNCGIAVNTMESRCSFLQLLQVGEWDDCSRKGKDSFYNAVFPFSGKLLLGKQAPWQNCIL